MTAAPERVLRVALAGLGPMGLMRASQVARNPRARLAFVADTNFALAQQVADTYRCDAYGDVSDVLVTRKQDVDAVMIATPTRNHCHLIRISARSAKPVFVEKPIDDDVDAIEEAYALADETGTPLLCSFPWRYDPDVTGGLSRAITGSLGRVHTLSTTHQMRWRPPKCHVSDGDPFGDLVHHDIDLARQVIGEEPSEVYAVASSFLEATQVAGMVDHVVLLLRFPSGAIAKLDISTTLLTGYRVRFEVTGADGSTSVVREGGSEDVSVYPPRHEWEAAYENQLDHFIDVALSCGERDATQPNVTALDTVQASRIAQAALQSHRTGLPVQLVPP